jgi:hypothetical protein
MKKWPLVEFLQVLPTTKEYYQKRKFHCRPVNNPTAMHQSMKITIRSSERSFPTSLTILVDSFVWLCCTRRQKQWKVTRAYQLLTHEILSLWWNMYRGWLLSSGFWESSAVQKYHCFKIICCLPLWQRQQVVPKYWYPSTNHTVSHHRRHNHKILKSERTWGHLRTKCSELAEHLWHILPSVHSKHPTNMIEYLCLSSALLTLTICT